MYRRPCAQRLAGMRSAASRAGVKKFFVDNKSLNRIWLERCGVTRIDVSCDCTKCQPERFWSHRVTQGHRGSLAAIIMLSESGGAEA